MGSFNLVWRNLTSQNIVKDPRFLMDNGYQLPIAARVGVKFTF